MESESNNMIVSVNPATGEILATLPTNPIEKVFDTVEAANHALAEWQAVPLKHRAQILKRAQQLLFEQSESIAGLITTEMGRPFAESLTLEVEATVDLIGYYSKEHSRLLSDRQVPLHNLFFKRRSSYIHHQPLGVLGIISPWNWPLLIPMSTIIPALLAGNGVVFKHSDVTPLVAHRIEKILHESGVPEQVFQTVFGKADVGQALVESDVVKIFFTGSTNVGRKVMQQSATLLKKCVLEMGGNDPALVCEDADIDNTSSGILWGAFNNCGQNCNGIERVYVNKRIADDFIERLAEKTKKLRIGHGMENDVDIGPLASKAQLAKINDIVAQAKQQGLKPLTGGSPVSSGNGTFFQPTIFLRDASVSHEPDQEIFGPVVFITPVEDDEQAIRMANNSKFGLSASIWTQNSKRGRYIAHQLACGNVMINDCIVSFGVTEMNWSGVKHSGIGWVHGEKGVDEMVNIQHIMVEHQSRIQKFWWFPYTERMIHAMRAGLQFLFAKSWYKKIRALPTILRHFTVYLLRNRRLSEKL